MAPREKVFAVRDYDLAATLESGQAFRWHRDGDAWTGVVAGRWVRLRQTRGGIAAEVAAPTADWRWLENFLQTETDFAAVLKTFPDDPPMRAAVAACRGLRLLRQEPWESLASFILSSTKQIVQIRQIVELLCARFGEPVEGNFGLRWQSAAATALSEVAATTKSGVALRWPPQSKIVPRSFPTAARIAALTEADLRDCKMGFRAPYLLGTARAVASGKIDLERLRGLPLNAARAELLRLPGVGRKIVDCVLLFGYGCDGAFPIDVWVRRALQQLYFPKRRASARRIEKFAATHFGPHAGYAQQYLFHYMRTKIK